MVLQGVTFVHGAGCSRRPAETSSLGDTRGGASITRSCWGCLVYVSLHNGDCTGKHWQRYLPWWVWCEASPRCHHDGGTKALCTRDNVKRWVGLMAEEVDERWSDTHNSFLLYSSSIMICILFWQSCYFIDLDCTIFLTFIDILFLYDIFGPSGIMYVYFLFYFQLYNIF